MSKSESHAGSYESVMAMVLKGFYASNGISGQMALNISSSSYADIGFLEKLCICFTCFYVSVAESNLNVYSLNIKY